jgi:hypothetical protein
MAVHLGKFLPCRALQGGGLAVQGTADPSWTALISSSVDSNGAMLPSNTTINSSKRGPPVITPLMGRYIPAAQAAGSQASDDLDSSAGGDGLQTRGDADQYSGLPGVGGGLQVLGATLLAHNSSFRFNTAARLGAAASIEQACWQVGRCMRAAGLVFRLIAVASETAA